MFFINNKKKTNISISNLKKNDEMIIKPSEWSTPRNCTTKIFKSKEPYYIVESSNTKIPLKFINQIQSFDYKIPKLSSSCLHFKEYIFLIHSAPKNFLKRSAIRNSWKETSKFCSFFLLGITFDENLKRKLEKEISDFDDIITVNVVDSYSNLVFKSLAGLEIFSRFFRKMKYFVKVDDDVIVNFENLKKATSTLNITEWGILGKVNRRSRVNRHGKWKNENYPLSFYPTYESGLFYMITADLISSILCLAKYIKIFPIEDVFLTGVIGQILGVKHYLHDGFCSATSRPLPPCVFRTTGITQTNFKNIVEYNVFWQKYVRCRHRK